MRALAVLVVLLMAAGCGSAEVEDGPALEETRGAGSPEQAVVELFAALDNGDFEAAAELTVDDQMILVALIEGITIEEALRVGRAAELEVGAGYWSGFQQSIEEILDGRVAVGSVERFEAGGRRFARVEVMFPLQGGDRWFVVQETDGWKIDVLASFASALAGKLGPVADSLRSNPKADPLMALMREQVPSLEAVLADESGGPALQQAAISAIEAIRR